VRSISSGARPSKRLWRTEPLKGRFLVSHNCLRAGKNSGLRELLFQILPSKAADGRLLRCFQVRRGNDDVEHFDATKALVEKMVDDLGRETCFDQAHNPLFGLGFAGAEPVLQITRSTSWPSLLAFSHPLWRRYIMPQ